MIKLEQFGSTQVVLYDGVPRFTYDLNSGSRIAPADAAKRLRDFAENIGEDGCLATRARAESLATEIEG